MSQIIKALLIEGSRVEANQIQLWLSTEEDSFEVKWVQDLKQGIDQLAKTKFDVVLLNLNLPDSRGLETFIKLQEAVAQVPIVVVGGHHDEANSFEIVRQHPDGASLSEVVRHAVARHRERLEKFRCQQIANTERVIGFWESNEVAGITTTARDLAVAMAMRGYASVLDELQLSSGKPVFHVCQQSAPDDIPSASGKAVEISCRL